MVNLYINERREGAISILDMKGRIRIGGRTTALQESIRCLIEEGKTQILLDLAGVTHIDSRGLGELVSSHAALSNKGGAMKLVHMTERVRDIMTYTRLLNVFEVYDDEPEALASFTGEVLRVVEPQPFFM
jgi:anti-sigma B factor antagonist